MRAILLMGASCVNRKVRSTICCWQVDGRCQQLFTEEVAHANANREQGPHSVTHCRRDACFRRARPPSCGFVKSEFHDKWSAEEETESSGLMEPLAEPRAESARLTCAAAAAPNPPQPNKKWISAVTWSKMQRLGRVLWAHPGNPPPRAAARSWFGGDVWLRRQPAQEVDSCNWASLTSRVRRSS